MPQRKSKQSVRYLVKIERTLTRRRRVGHPKGTERSGYDEYLQLGFGDFFCLGFSGGSCAGVGIGGFALWRFADFLLRIARGGFFYIDTFVASDFGHQAFTYDRAWHFFCYIFGRRILIAMFDEQPRFVGLAAITAGANEYPRAMQLFPVKSEFQITF